MPQPIASPVTLDNAQSLSGTPKMAAQNVNFFYGSSQALFDVSLTFPERQVTALIGPSGCGKSTFLRCLNRMNDLIPGTRTEGLHHAWTRQDINAPNFDVVNLRRRVGMVFQKPDAVPEDDFRKRGLRPARQRRARRIAHRRQGGGRPPPRRHLRRGEGPPAHVGARALRRPAAAPVHRPRPCRGAGSPAHGRTRQRPRPHRHAAHRGRHPTS